MEGKIPAVIKSITLDGRTYHNVALSPTLINAALMTLMQHLPTFI